MRFSQLRQRFRRGPWKWLLLLVLILLGLSIWRLSQHHSQPHPPIQSYSQLETRLASGKISSLRWNPDTYTVTVHERDRPAYTIGVPAVNSNQGLTRILNIAQAHHVNVSSTPVASDNPSLVNDLLRLSPTLLVLLLLLWLARSYGPLARQRITPALSEVTFDDVAGAGEAVEELIDVRSFLADPRRYERIGARVPKGVLLYGPPGTGKTLLAKAVAHEAGIPFYSATGSEFVELFAGLGARRVRELFEQAKKNAPSIIFIDELDAVGSKRSGGGGDGGTREADQTLIQILKEMDGFDVSDNPVIIIGATNRLDTLDPALTRPGRFDRHISIDPPDRAGRRAIIAIHAIGKPFDASVDLDTLAQQTSGMAGADLALLLNESALLAARHNAETISARDLDDAYFRIVAGAKRHNRALSTSERRTVAYHEAGHALVAELLHGPDKVHKISVIPRGQSGGQTLFVSDEDVFLFSQQALRDRIAGLLAGRASEQLTFGRITSGAADDLERATRWALKMITELGMGETLGFRVATDTETRVSEHLREQIDREVQELLLAEYQRAEALLAKDHLLLNRVATALLDEETLDRQRFLDLLGMTDLDRDEHLLVTGEKTLPSSDE
jgi:cell division protease FtsH